MNKEIITRVKLEAEYIINTKTTIRKIAEKFGISKSTVHKDMKERLKEIDIENFKIIQDIFQEHIETRHILGGQSTKEKYLQIKKVKDDNMRDIGIDLGTTNILIYVKGKGIVLNEPSVVSIDTDTKKVLAVGKEAKEMLGRTPDKVQIIKPMKDGVIADFDATEELLRRLIKKAFGKKILTKPRILICCPSNITGVEKNAIREIAERMGSRRVYLEEEPKVAAIGAGIDISKPSGSMVIDIGGGTTDIAVLSLGAIVTSDSIRIAGNSFDDDIINFIKNKYKIIIGEKTAEDIKTSIGTVLKNSKSKSLEITGRSSLTGLPEATTVTSEDVEEALKEDIKKIINSVKLVLEKTPPELAADISNKGIILTGGGSLIDGLVEKLRKELKVPVFISDNPLTNVAEGTGIILDNLYLIDN